MFPFMLPNSVRQQQSRIGNICGRRLFAVKLSRLFHLHLLPDFLLRYVSAVSNVSVCSADLSYRKAHEREGNARENAHVAVFGTLVGCACVTLFSRVDRMFYSTRIKPFICEMCVCIAYRVMLRGIWKVVLLFYTNYVLCVDGFACAIHTRDTTHVVSKRILCSGCFLYTNYADESTHLHYAARFVAEHFNNEPH